MAGGRNLSMFRPTGMRLQASVPAFPAPLLSLATQAFNSPSHSHPSPKLLWCHLRLPFPWLSVSSWRLSPCAARQLPAVPLGVFCSMQTRKQTEGYARPQGQSVKQATRPPAGGTNMPDRPSCRALISGCVVSCALLLLEAVFREAWRRTKTSNKQN